MNQLLLYPRHTSEIRDWMTHIARSLLQNYSLTINDNEFRFREIEFYLYHAELNHTDRYTYKRDVKRGGLFFHINGVDISFDSIRDSSQKLVAYGGILIRTIEAADSELFCGPRNVQMRLCNCLSIGTNNSVLIERKSGSDRIPIYTGERKVGDLKNNSDYKERNYRFLSDFNRFDEDYKKRAINSYTFEILD